jgi:hypothetical protein
MRYRRVERRKPLVTVRCNFGAEVHRFNRSAKTAEELTDDRATGGRFSDFFFKRAQL